eukprot:Opistho-2@72842
MVDRAFKDQRANKRDTIDNKFNYADKKIGEGTYGVVYKATKQNDPDPREYALKKFKSISNTEGLSSSACREIALLRELKHENVIGALEVHLNPFTRDVWIVFEYAEHDLLQILQWHRELPQQSHMRRMHEQMMKSILWQILNGLHYLHSNWVLHRDLKPANILVMSKDSSERGRVKIADLGMARLFNNPLKPLSDLDPVVVTIWYRAPELLLGAKHYTKAIDIWAVGCIFAELVTSRPLFHGRQAEDKKNAFQKDQLEKVMRVMGFPNLKEWPNIAYLQDYPKLINAREFNPKSFEKCTLAAHMAPFMRSRAGGAVDASGAAVPAGTGQLTNSGFALLSEMLAFDPSVRITPKAALAHDYFKEDPRPTMNAFEGVMVDYPKRSIIADDPKKPKQASLPAQPAHHVPSQVHKGPDSYGTAKHPASGPALGHPGKKLKTSGGGHVASSHGYSSQY